jgi:DNA invertase Pin-like site-specific DNA recombinase
MCHTVSQEVYPNVRVIGYLRVSTREQGDAGSGLEAQEATIRSEVERRGWSLVEVRKDVASGKSLRKRDELGRTLRDLRDGKADALVVAKLDRLSRSMLDFASVMETATKEGWSVVVLDLGVDTTTMHGELIASIMAALAQWERRMIGDRTRSALEAVKARGTRLGRPSGVDPETLRLISALRHTGLSWQKVANALTAQGVPTGQGGAWHAATVRRLHDRRTSN